MKYYPMSDLAYGYALDRAVERITDSNLHFNYEDVNDILELENIRMYLDDLARHQFKLERNVPDAKTMADSIRERVRRFFGALELSGLPLQAQKVKPVYRDDFLRCLLETKKNPWFSGNDIADVLVRMGFPLKMLLKSRRLVRLQGNQLSAAIEESIGSAEMLIDAEYEMGEFKEIYFPSCLGLDAKRGLIKKYIDWENANPNYLKVLAQCKPKNDELVDPVLRLNASRRHRQLVDDLFSTQECINQTSEVVFDPSEEMESKLIEYDLNGSDIRVTISTKYLLSSLDFESILDNFVYLFGYTRFDGMLSYVPIRGQESVFESILGMNRPQDFPDTWVSMSSVQLGILLAQGYFKFLRSQNIELEEVISWFFKEYLNREFGIENFEFVANSRDSDYYTRCHQLFPQFDGVLSQFVQIARHGHIEQELRRFERQPINFREVPSLLKGKYVRVPSSDPILVSILKDLFSQNSDLGLVSMKSQSSCLADLVSERRVSIEDFHPYRQNLLEELLARGILVMQDESKSTLAFKSTTQLEVLRMIYEAGAVMRLGLRGNLLDACNELVKSGVLQFEDYLLSKEEGEYFDYCLNDKFPNSLFIRNSYAHARTSASGDDEEHFQNYLLGVQLMIFLVIKINDELCIRSRIRERVDNSLKQNKH